MRRLWRVLGVASVIALAGCSDDPVAPTTEVTVSGRVLNPDASGAASAMVSLEPLVQGSIYMIQIGSTDAGGNFSFVNVLPGDYVLAARAEPPGTHVAATHMRLPGLRTRPVLRLAAPGSVAGRVTLSDSNLLDGSAVSVQATFNFSVTDAEGDYRIDGVPVGTWRVYANRPGYETRSVTVTIPNPGAMTQVPEMTLSPGATPAAPSAASRP